MFEKAEDLGYDRWPQVLTAAGIPESHFSGRNGPCPICGGTDRYRWAKKKGGLWVCSQCTNSAYASPMRLLMLHMGYHNFRDAADHVREYFGENSTSKSVVRPTIQQEAAIEQEKFRKNYAKMERLWSEGIRVEQGDPVDLYMSNRVPGVQLRTENIRFHPALEYWLPPEKPGGRFELLGKYPGMMARAQHANGDFVQLHKTFLTWDGQKADVPLAKKTESGVGANAFAIRVCDVPGDVLGVSEGIESGYGGAMLRGIPVWPCLNGPSLERFELPEYLRRQVRRLVIFGDHDHAKLKTVDAHGEIRLKKPGSLYAESLARRARNEGLRPLVIMPAKLGYDMANQWVQHCQTHAQ